MPYVAGEVIFQCDPWIYSVSTGQTDDRCHRCLGSLSVDNRIVCFDCEYAKYCSEPCRAEDFRQRHEDECHIFKCLFDGGYHDAVPTDFILAIRILVLLKKGPLEKCPVTGRSFLSLISHEEELQKDAARMEEIEFYYDLLCAEIMVDYADTLPGLGLFTQIMGKLQCNAFGIVDESLVSVGEGLYLGPSMLDHSCDRSATYYFDGPKICVKAIKSIPSLQEVRISYVDCFVPRNIRLHLLEARYFFRCVCRLCLNNTLAEMYSIRCVTAECSQPVPLDDRALEPCPGCGVRNNTTNSATYRRSEGMVADHERLHETFCRDEDSGNDLTLLSSLVEDERKFFHPRNMLYGLTCERIGRILAERNDTGSLKLALQSLELFMFSLRTFYSEWDIVVGMAALTTAETAMKLEEFPTALKYASEAEKIFQTVDSETRALCRLARSFRVSCESQGCLRVSASRYEKFRSNGNVA